MLDLLSVYLDTGWAPDFAARFEKRWGTWYTTAACQASSSLLHAVHTPHGLLLTCCLHLLRIITMCYCFPSRIILSDESCVCGQGRCLFDFTVSLSMRNSKSSHLRKYPTFTETRLSWYQKLNQELELHPKKASNTTISTSYTFNVML